MLSTCIIAIRLATEGKERVLGVAYVDQGMKRLGMCEFIENDQFSNLEVSQWSFRPLALTVHLDRHSLFS